MKILPISYPKFTSQTAYNNYDMSYLYTLSENESSDNSLSKFTLMTGLAALTAVAVTLFNLSDRRKFSYAIAEIKDTTKGLNKIKGQDELVSSLKSDFVYPIKSYFMGDKRIKNTKEFKTGLIITGENPDILQDISHALIEHFEELGIQTQNLPTKISKIRADKVVEKELKRNELNKILYNMIDDATEFYKKEGKYTVIDLGDISKLTDLRVIKSQESNFEKLISDLSSDNRKGIIWIGRTTQQKALPLFLAYLPVLIKKTK